MKPCEQCGQQFQPRRREQRYCGRYCASRTNGQAGRNNPPNPYAYLEYVPAQPIRDMLNRVYQQGWTQREIASATGVAERLLYRVNAPTRPAPKWWRTHKQERILLTKYGWVVPQQHQVTLSLADRIIVGLGLDWFGDPELAAIYEREAA